MPNYPKAYFMLTFRIFFWFSIHRKNGRKGERKRVARKGKNSGVDKRKKGQKEGEQLS